MRKPHILAIIILLLLLIGFIWWRNGLKAVNANSTSSEMFIIRKGETIREIANKLKSEDLIRDPVVFFIYIKTKGNDKNVQAGNYRLSPSMDLKTLVDTLDHGRLDIWVTIPEGIRAEEIADILQSEIPSYQDEWRVRLNENEGYLFPDTYLIPRDASIDTVINMLRNNFDRKIVELNVDSDSQSFNSALIIASLIEREAKFDKDRPLVSSVIHNRLNIGMKLDIDATLQYALGYQADEKRWWKEGLTNEDKRVESLYNTYARNGLPPTPIGNPGIVSIGAALNPAETDYLYYVSDENGDLHYAKTLNEHNLNVEEYLN